MENKLTSILANLPTTEETIEEEARKIFRKIREYGVPLKRPYCTEERFVRWVLELYKMVADLEFKRYCEVKVTLKMGKAIVGVERKGNYLIVVFFEVYRSLKPKKLLGRHELRIVRLQKGG